MSTLLGFSPFASGSSLNRKPLATSLSTLPGFSPLRIGVIIESTEALLPAEAAILFQSLRIGVIIESIDWDMDGGRHSAVSVPFASGSSLNRKAQ